MATTSLRLLDARWPPTPEDAAKYLGALGVVVYALLFLAYRTYFDRLGISPEDVGVTNSFVLARSLGFVLLTAVVLLLVLSHLWVNRPRSEEEGDSDAGVVLRTLLGVLTFAVIGYYFYALFPAENARVWVLPLVVIGLIALPQVLLAGIRRARKLREGATGGARTYLVASIVVSLVVALLTPAVAVVLQATARADAARTGAEVRSLTAFQIPILDTSTVPVTVTWQASTPPPPGLFPPGGAPATDGTLLGQGANGVAYFALLTPSGPRIVRLNNASVAVLLRPS